MICIKEIEVGGKKITIETGRYARQASGAVMVRCGDTMVLVTAVAAAKPMEDIDFFPLQVEYREKLSAAGKIPGGFLKREGKPSDNEVLSGRLIDRPIRPLFPDEFRHETQIVATVYSFDTENDPDVLAIVGASAALTISHIPFLGPIAGVRMGRVDGQFIVNPTFEELGKSDMELVVAGTEDSIMMVEGEAKEVSEQDMIDALRVAQEAIRKIVEVQRELQKECGVEKMVITPAEVNAELVEDVRRESYEKLKEVIYTVLPKQERADRMGEIFESVTTALAEKYPEQEKVIKRNLDDLVYELIRKSILEEGKRLDGRSTTDIRPITVELGLLPRVHGSALFTRGETQSLTTLTLGTSNDEQIIDGLKAESTKRFILHYNFPPFSVGETGRMTGVGRREVGHGNLAERSLKNMIPESAEFPYTIRLISDILESNGSSSMATVCAGSLSLMDGGVPVKYAVAGIAMGLIKEGDSFAVLSDILGNEDHYGDMDFKVAGTSNGITGFQMDIKIRGVSFEIMETALRQAREGRLHILGIMNSAISEPRPQVSQHAPGIIQIKVETDQIGMLIGPGGKTVQGMQKDFGVEIAIEDDGTVNIASANRAAAQACKDHIKKMTMIPEIGAEYDGVVVKIMEFGALVEILPGKSGLLHISEIDHKRVASVTDYLKEGDPVKVKLLRMENGKMSLSRRALIERPAHSGDSSEKRDHHRGPRPGSNNN